MPYIKDQQRAVMDQIVDQMAHTVKANGDLNYILYAFCKRHINPSYNDYKNYLGELNEAAEEIRRRMLAPYEDRKIMENGDVI